MWIVNWCKPSRQLSLRPNVNDLTTYWAVC